MCVLKLLNKKNFSNRRIFLLKNVRTYLFFSVFCFVLIFFFKNHYITFVAVNKVIKTLYTQNTNLSYSTKQYLKSFVLLVTIARDIHSHYEREYYALLLQFEHNIFIYFWQLHVF